MNLVLAQAVRRDIGLLEWLFDADTWTGGNGILAAAGDTVRLCAAVVVTATLVAVPLGAVLAHIRRGELVATWVVNVGRAIPTFAVAGLLVPISLRWGLGFEPWPIFVALTLLSVPPIFLTTFTAVARTDPVVVDAARGMGFEGRAVLLKVESALALSVIMTGVRVASVQVVATEPIRAFLGGGGLGGYLRDGLGQNNDTLVLGGAMLVAVLAAITGAAFGVLERIIVPRGVRRLRRAGDRRPGATGMGPSVLGTSDMGATMDTRQVSRRWARLFILLTAFSLLTAACGSDDDTAGSGSTTASTVGGPTIRIRGQDFSESATIAQVYGQYLTAKGYQVEILTPAGFRTEAIDALKSGDVNLIVDYIGGAAAALSPNSKATGEPDQVIDIITPAFRDIGATVLDYSPAVDGDAFVVRGDSPATRISDVKNLDYVLGASAQCEERPQCFVGFTDPAVYGITFKEYKKIDFGPQLGEGLSAKEVDAVVWNTTAPQIKEKGFKVLEDDKRLFPAQNIAPILLTSLSEAYGARLTTALDTLSGTITTDDLVAWNVETDIQFKESDDVATGWLKKKGLA